MMRTAPRLLVPLVLLVLLLAGACSGRGSPAGTLNGMTATTRAGAPPPAEPLPVAPAPEPIRADYLADRMLHRASHPAPVQLGRPPHPALQGTLAPLVVPSPDGRTLAYTTFAETATFNPSLPLSAHGIGPGDALGTPSIWLHDLASGQEQLVAEGAYAPAWRHDGALAFVQGDDVRYRAGVPYMGQVVVRPAGGEPSDDEQWTRAGGRYVVAGWAGDRLLVYHDAGLESFDIEVLDRPGEVRTLAPASSLIALSPDAQKAAVATSANGRSSEVQVLAVADGNPVHTLVTDGLTSLVYGGSWVGSRIVARGGDARGALLEVFEVGPEAFNVTQVLRVDPRLPTGLSEPRLNTADPNQVTAWSFLPDTRTYVLVRCDLRASSCTSGPPVRAKVVRLYSTP